MATTAAHLPQLTPISVLLDAFNHRNKNQHRRSHWWRQFNLLRRALRRLIVAPALKDPRPSLTTAFTQLAADNQYAPLGLVLLEFSPASAPSSHPFDMGVAISRSELTSDLMLPEETARKVAPQRRGRDEPLAQAPRKPPKEFVPGPAQGRSRR
ncbi:unnamed protein product [Parascedosporium putredinis]|uniref:RNase MRP protein 1 RNA binding domain-containing protein n=1 Tax=Parascedosporium putredinis TaxID=1442378 RepID=A0A9P1GXI4_9PEZI|nr:unnamed protein product [Parascedosporium putredinis]CAI7989047.1 unnamed protein product [Parascedosporium putredinis]